jgi:hypothetical protein
MEDYPKTVLEFQKRMLQRKPASSIWSRYVSRMGSIALAVVIDHA